MKKINKKKSNNIDRILRRASHSLVKEIKNIQYSKMAKLENDIKTLDYDLIQSCPHFKKQILTLLNDSYKRKYEEVKKIQINKFRKLHDLQVEKLLLLPIARLVRPHLRSSKI